jgi:hypothetical protein
MSKPKSNPKSNPKSKLKSKVQLDDLVIKKAWQSTLKARVKMVKKYSKKHDI